MKLDINEIIAKFKYDPSSVKKDKTAQARDIYLARVSYRYEYFKRICLVLLVLIIVAFIFSGSISYENFYYLVKDVGLAHNYVSTVHDTVTYNIGNSQSFALYREGIAVASRESFYIFSADGRELFSSRQSYSNPALYSSDKYVLLCDIGGKQFSLYNSFSRVREETLDAPVYGAAISKSGDFAIITASEKYDSTVKVYRENGREYDYGFASGRVLCVAFSDNGTRMAVALAFSEGDSVRCEIRAYNVGSDSYDSKPLTFSGLAYEVKMLDGGNIAVVGKHGVNVFTPNLLLLGEYLPEREIYSYGFGEDNIAVSHLAPDGALTQTVCLDIWANPTRGLTSAEATLDLELCGGYMFVQRLSGFERVSVLTGRSVAVSMPANEFKMACDGTDGLVVFAPSYAKFLSFE